MTHKARKRFGQNFLTDHSIISNILSCLQMHTGEHWVEIGPGQGALTKPLLEKAGMLDVVELDRDLVVLLTKQFANAQNLHIHSADALQFDFSSLTKNNEKYRLIGNLPYNISTPLLFHLLNYPSCISDMHFMLQKEVVDRICASPNSKSYGRLSVMLQYYCEAEHLFDVPPECFDPVPKVTSAIIRLIPHIKPPVELTSVENFKSLVAHAFSQRRKTIRNSLKKLMNEEVFAELGIDPTARAENLSLLDFARLSNQI
ncbi:16S rRNA (adenine(1518)-N(6)/adenine(1519)-N(6))-dimethyltransferase RsmA [Methylicorpusculum sp.]|uniref:16S rRNA (adenine(1518)-N(6)/adenine(1519)-N(6))- dimethyltransferase RsmA n=1 Tax=Methylicorpusculum sp. TaxID=2713644 RepID=UPI00271DBB03|nr:16S rRNA (adenine(1518)-N(6)/adenine(1519)-N(6))-dimethyltransferase RsmA [Methylicorpusculum sp.]MDO8843153.1 16S rRNA (adenine(1518)-N(6)/adenine(1519)-N(6))-dimethyltransferase RsmA [Methylicorpusculum sp.]